MEKIKKILLMHVPMSICNFRCHYCYLAQRDEAYQNQQPKMQYTPEEVARACSVKRLGGLAYMNFCAEGETLLTKDIDLYVRALVEEGHYAEIVSNLTITPMLEKILAWPQNILKRVEFKCSFHYLELKKRGLLDIFAQNVQKIWEAGASANIEITPSDALIPYLDEVKAFSLANFGALPHITIARDDRTKGIEKLTQLSEAAYAQTWGQFDSDFWKYKMEIFGKPRKGFCYAGKWSAYINMATGQATQCYIGEWIGNAFANPDAPFPEKPIGKCPIAHCYNGHMLMTLGLIPGDTEIRYGDIRNRVREDGSMWLQPELLAFFNSQCIESNERFSRTEEKKMLRKRKTRNILRFPRRMAGKIWRAVRKNKRGEWKSEGEKIYK